MSHVFISYKREDGRFANEVKRQVEAAGFQVWIDRERLRAGENWREAISEAIKSALALVVIMTPEARMSEYITYEWAFALGSGVQIIPVLLRPTSLHPQLEQLHYLDFTNSQKLPWDSLIGRLLEIEHEHTPEMVRVPRHAPAAVKQAVAALDSFAPDERKVAVKTLAQMNHPAAQAALAAAVQHPMRDVRVAAAFSLAELTQYTDARAVPGLVDALRDESPDVRYSAALALAEICDPSAVPGLIEAMFDITIGARARKACAKALECIGTPEALEAVERWRQ